MGLLEQVFGDGARHRQIIHIGTLRAFYFYLRQCFKRTGVFIARLMLQALPEQKRKKLARYVSQLV